MSLIEHAKVELAAVNFGDDDSRVMVEILEKFFDQWDSGGAVSVVAPVLQRLIAGKPLSPLTGADSEWFVHDANGCYAQNIRCSTVFRATKDGPAYDIDVPGRPPITFPYWPDRAARALPWQPISEVPDDNEAWLIVRTSKDSVAPGHVMRCRRGMLSDRPGPNHLRIFADYFMPYVEPSAG